MGQVQNHVINPAVMTDAMLGYLDRHPEQAEHAWFEANSTFTSSCSTRSSQDVRVNTMFTRRTACMSRVDSQRSYALR
jgi:hypothetical protein